MKKQAGWVLGGTGRDGRQGQGSKRRQRQGSGQARQGVWTRPQRNRKAPFEHGSHRFWFFKKLLYIRIMGSSPAMKRSRLRIHTATRMTLQGTIQSEREKPTSKVTERVIPCVRHSQNDSILQMEKRVVDAMA